MNQKSTPMTAMAFHPHHMILGCSSREATNTFEIGKTLRGRASRTFTDFTRLLENYPSSLAAMTFSQSVLGKATFAEEDRISRLEQRHRQY